MTRLRTLAACSLVTLLGLAGHAQTPALYGVRGQVTTAKGNPCPRDLGDKALLACAKAKPDGSPEAMLAYANLGTRAIEADNTPLAACYYLHTIPPGDDEIIIDARFHANRAAAFHSIGRDAIALADARKALEFMDQGVLDPGGAILNDAAESHLLMMLLRPLVELKAPEADRVVARYLDLPANDWMESANRSANLTLVGRYDEAMAPLDAALKGREDNPLLNNNKCDLLVKMGHAADALAYCEVALAGAPRHPAVLMTNAEALSGLGRCDEAKASRATAIALAPKQPALREKLSCER